jgi:hypothetical protein
MFGANHGEIGACLVGMWNMPGSVVEAAALHHEPPLGEHQHLTPLAAVHIANVLEHQFRPGDECRVAPAINTAFLNELGLLQRLPVWRAVLAKRRAASAGLEVEPAEESQPELITPVLSSTPPPPRTATELAAPTAATRTGTLGQPGSKDNLLVALASRQRRWFYAGAAAALLGLLALWLETPPEVPVHALTPVPTLTRAPLVVSSAPAPAPAPAAVPETTPAMEVSEDASATEADTAPDPAPALPKPEPTVATAPPVTATNAPPPTPAPLEQAWPEFRLSCIIYTVARPSAIVNRETVYVGDQVGGATVVGIDRTRVTLEINGQRKTCVLQ